MSWLKNMMKNREKHTPVSLNDQNFQREVKHYKGAVLVDVWGPGCAPCTKLAPIMEDLATEYHGRIKVCELNASSAPRSAGSMGVRGTPTTVAYKNGAEIGRIVGWKPKSYWKQLLEKEFPEYISGEMVPEEAPLPEGREPAPKASKPTTKAARKAARRARRKK